MASDRPGFMDLRSQSQASMASTSRPMRSPRLHIAGEAPPELSPLDAFALQSRLLAKQLEESEKQGRRMSRLPPLTIESPLIVQGRSDYFRSMSHDSGSERGSSPIQSAGLGLRMGVEMPGADRPTSMHPRMSTIPPTPDNTVPMPTGGMLDQLRSRDAGQVDDGNASFGYGLRREESPTPMEQAPQPQRNDTTSQLAPSATTGPNQSPEKLLKKASFDSTLAPPRPLFAKRSSSLTSSPMDGTDESGSVASSSFHSQPPRQLSSSSSAFSANPASSPHTSSFTRSPSLASDVSAGLPRPSFNFSRPLSRADSSGVATPPRQASSDSHPFIVADDSANTPTSMNSEDFPDHAVDEPKATPASSYIYSKFSLPRGKIVSRTSFNFSDVQPLAAFQWEQPIVPPSNVRTIPQGGQAPPSPTRTSSSSRQGFLDDHIITLPYLNEESAPDTGNSAAANQPSPAPNGPSTEDGRSSEDVPRGRTMTQTRDKFRGRTPLSISTSDSGSTVKPTSQFSFAASSADMTAEEHLTKGIDCHQSGSLNESTYHLRHAARLGHPTGMLLYALACRHGWGMRPNQKEAVEWLRRAADCASLEIAEDEDEIREGRHVDSAERRTRKAQLALSIYELGVSHMNGWGIEEDRTLALRCFEVAGSLGDVDALAEAGFCYAQGIGCKKDLKKSAKFYRMAEAKGMSMVGNSWIHKSKYNEDEKAAKDAAKAAEKKEKKARSKSRTRTIFGLKTSS